MTHMNSVRLQNERTKGFDLNDLESLSKYTQAIVRKYIRSFNPDHFLPVDDVAWDCFTTLYTRGFFHKFDIKSASTNTYLYNGVRNYLVDQQRYALSRPKGVSIDSPLAGSDGLRLVDILDARLSEVVVGLSVYAEVADRNEEITRLLEKHGNKYARIGQLGSVYLNEYSVLYLHLFMGYRVWEIEKVFGVSGHIVSKLLKYGTAVVERVADENGSDSADIYEMIENNIRTNEDTVAPVCPHCGSANTRFWTDETWSALPSYYCRECDRYYTVFTGTALNPYTNKSRLNILKTGLMTLDGYTRGQISVRLDIGVEKVQEYREGVLAEFNEDNPYMIRAKFNKWVKQIEKAESIKATWKNN